MRQRDVEIAVLDAAAATAAIDELADVLVDCVDVKKLLVHRSARRRGVGPALMAKLEEEARVRGRWLLVLDSATGPAERLYTRLGWTRAGVIPNYTLWPDGSLCDTIYFWKRV